MITTHTLEFLILIHTVCILSSVRLHDYP